MTRFLTEFWTVWVHRKSHRIMGWCALGCLVISLMLWSLGWYFQDGLLMGLYMGALCLSYSFYDTIHYRHQIRKDMIKRLIDLRRVALHRDEEQPLQLYSPETGLRVGVEDL